MDDPSYSVILLSMTVRNDSDAALFKVEPVTFPANDRMWVMADSFYEGYLELAPGESHTGTVQVIIKDIEDMTEADIRKITIDIAGYFTIFGDKASKVIGTAFFSS